MSEGVRDEASSKAAEGTEQSGEQCSFWCRGAFQWNAFISRSHGMCAAVQPIHGPREHVLIGASSAGIMRPDLQAYLSKGGLDKDSAIYRAAVKIQSRYRGFAVQKVPASSCL